LEVARFYAEAGWAGIVLKGHFESTVGRARVLSTAADIPVYGGIVLNQSVGGLNATAVGASLALGGRIVWMPTVDARAHRNAGLPVPTGYGAGNEQKGGERTGSGFLACPPCDWSTEFAVRAVLAAIADADAVLATGHLSTTEIAWLVPEARKAGVRRIVITHPTFTVPNMRIKELRELVDMGAHMEITAYQLLHQPGITASDLVRTVEAVGASRLILSSDSGQCNSPPGPEGLATLIDALVGAGLDRAALEASASEVPERLFLV
jgi:hypothetical protein